MDADCLVAGTLAASGAASELLALWRGGEFELIACPHLVEEVRDVLLEPGIAKRYQISRGEVEELCRQLEAESLWLPDPSDPPRVVPNDPDDDYLVALALAAGADAIVTRDRHFEEVIVRGVRILPPRRFRGELEARRRSQL